MVLAVATADRAGAEGAQRTWSVSASLRQIHTSNTVPYLADGPSDVLDSPSAGVTYARTTAKGSIVASLSGWGLLFHDQTEFNRLGTSFSLSGSRRLSPRASLSVSGASTSGLSGESVYSTGFLFPSVDVSTRQGSARLTFLLGSSTTAAFDVTAARTSFIVGIPLAGAQLTVDPALLQPLPFPGLAEAPLPGAPRALDASLLALSILASEGVLASEIDFSTYGGGLALTHNFSAGVAGTAWVRHHRIGLSTGANRDGGRTDASFALTRTFGPASRLSLSYAHAQNGIDSPGFTSRSLSAQGERTINKHWKMEASLGYSLLGSSGAGLGESLIGGLGISGQRGRTRVHARYHRTPFVAYGLGRNEVTDFGSVGLSRSFTRRLSGWLDAQYRHSRDPLDSAFSISTRSFGGGLGYLFHERTQLGADYSRLAWSGFGSLERIDSAVWSVFISYGKSFR